MDIELKTPLPGSDANTLEVTLGYTKGGMNYFNGAVSKRGLYVYFRAVELRYSEATGFASRSFVMFGGPSNDFKVFLLPMARDNKKKVAALADKLEAADKDLILDLYMAGKKGELAMYVAGVLGLEYPVPAAA